MAHDQSKTWAKWLSTAEWWYNTTYHTNLNVIPFQALYGNAPPQFLDAIDFSSASLYVEELLAEREDMKKMIRQRLLKI